MTACDKDADAYLPLPQGLLPEGPAWTRDLDAVLTALLRVDAGAAAALHNRLCQLVGEMNPLTTLEMLIQREIEAGLPDACTPAAQTLEQRRAAVVGKWAGRGGASPAFFRDLAASIGFSICVVEPRPFKFGHSQFGDCFANDPWIRHFRIGSPAETVTAEFRTGISAAGDPLRSWGNDALECLITLHKPAHVTLSFAYGDDVCAGLPGAVVTS